MTPQEIIDAYGVLSQEINDRAASDAAAIGNGQRSIGGLAEAVANPSGQTSGLANYTYNRLLRPTVDTTVAALTTQGKAQSLQTELTNRLLAAKQNYEDSKNRYTVASTTPSTTNNNNGKELYDEQTDPTSEGEKIPYPKAGEIISVGHLGNNRYDVIVADGKGGFIRHETTASSEDEARKKFLGVTTPDTPASKYLDKMENGGGIINNMIKQINQQGRTIRG